jgi:peroxiredoxin Q/BCP
MIRTIVLSLSKKQMAMLSRRTLSVSSFALVALLASGRAQAQQPAPLTVGPAVGETAPDFEFQGITRYGVLKERMKLSDLKGQAVVLAFFPKARTKG